MKQRFVFLNSALVSFFTPKCLSGRCRLICRGERRLLLLISAFVFCINSSFAITTDNDGVYQIATAEDLVTFADIVNGGTTSANAKVTANITATSDFTPIGNSSNLYTGTFDGGGYTITLSINTSSDCQGLFGYVGSCTIKNVTVGGTVIGNTCVGGIAARVNSGGANITNCHNNAAITGKDHVGGILGIVNYSDTGTTTIKNCSNTGNIKATNSAGAVGGILGTVSKIFTITACANSGSVSKGYYDSGGGIVGYFNLYNYNSSITSCYNEVSGLKLYASSSLIKPTFK